MVGRKVFIGVMIVIAVILIVIFAEIFGFIDLGILSIGTDDGNDVPSLNEMGFNDSSDNGFDDFDVYGMLCLITDKTLDYDTTMQYIERLNMEAYCSSTSYVDIYGEYSLYYENEGWNLEYRSFGTDTAVIVYSKTGQGASVVTSSLAEVEIMYGCNTLTLTSSGSIGTYTAFINFVMSS